MQSAEQFATVGLMVQDYPIEERRRLAEAYGINPTYLYQCLSGHRQMAAAEARALEERSNGELKRWQLRVHDWFLIWPELIGMDGAPEVPCEREGA